MVSAKIKKDLEIAYKDLANTSVDLDSYDGQLLSLAFDIFTSDTFIAGIAEKILSGDCINNDDRIILIKPLIVDDVYWVTNSGQVIDINDDKPLFELAKKIETVRKICSTVVS
ncbi:MAG: hypothetical protein ACR2MD_12045 [Aridibacter sp.]|jgi:hypothetical protein